jgi:hypothetical protein
MTYGKLWHSQLVQHNSVNAHTFTGQDGCNASR